MASIDLTAEQILDAARQLPEAERKRLLVALQERPNPRQARERARQLRRNYRLPPNQRARLRELLAKGNAGTLTRAQSTELDRLVEIFEKKTHSLALAISRTKPRAGSR